jgi:glycerophosphoryl diester phosphodiesterase
MTIAAHRGAAELAPENTLDAYRYAIAYGVEMIEIDVQQTLDGRYVSFHDMTLDEKTNGAGPIAALTYDEVRALNAADNDKWRGSVYDPAQVPSLEEILRLARDTGTGIYFDMKESVTNPAGVALIAKDFGVVADSAFLTYEPARAAVIRAALPDADIMLSNPGLPAAMLYAIGADYTWFGSSLPSFTPEVIAAIHDACGLAIPNVYQGDVTGSEAGDLLHARSIGADGAQVNNPDVVADALDEPVATRLEFRAAGAERQVCLVDAAHGLGLPEKRLSIAGNAATTGRGGCVDLPASFGRETVTFSGDGSTLPTGSTPTTERDPYEHFIGALHEHSGYSDGWPGSRPEDYFDSAEGFGLDFLGSGEHSDNAELPITASEGCLDPATIATCAASDQEEPTANFRKWEETRDQAQTATDDNFTAFRGFEWTSDRFGHINVYFSENFTNAKSDGGYGAMETFWSWFQRAPSLNGGADGLATFNHPGDKNLSTDDPGYNWNGFAYVPEADERMVGLEVYNGDRDYVSFERGNFYAQALDAGWHVGAVGGEDLGHDRPEEGTACPPESGPTSEKCWGHPRWAKTVLIAETRSPDDLREAMAARRMYAVLDPDTRIEMSVADLPMGSRLTRPTGTTVPISVEVPSGAERIDLLSNGGEVVATASGSSLRFDAPVTDEERWYFARVWNQRRGESSPIAYTSPVWIGGGASLAPLEVDLQAPESGSYSDPVAVTAIVTSEGRPVSGQEITFTLGARSVEATSDALGNVSGTVQAADEPGVYELSASAPAGHTYGPGTDSATFTIERETTVLRYTGDTAAAKGRMTLRAELTEDDGPPVSGRTVVFTIGAEQFSAVTDGSGVATKTVRSKKGSDVATRFAGDAFYLPSFH